MPSRKKIADVDSSAVVPTSGSQPAPLPSSKLPPLMRFPLYCIISLSVAALLHTFVADVTGYELRTVSRTFDDNWRITATLVTRIAELAVGWSERYDDLDLASLTVLTHSPYLFLLSTFYGISNTTVLSSLGITVLATSIPTRLLRPRAPVHNPRAPAAAVPNRSIIADLQILLSTSFFGAALYSLTVWSALRVFGLPHFMASHFDGLRSLEHAHVATLQGLFIILAPLGYAAREFLLTPTLGAKAAHPQDEPQPFDPATATLRETLEYNLVGDKYRAKVATRRALVLTGLVFANTAALCVRSLDGTDFVGAAGYAGVWAFASLVAGLGFRWVGDV